MSPHPSAWDEFVRNCAKERWVTVGLRTGDAYLGKLHYGDDAVPQNERDIVLAEPALYDQEKKNYVSTANQFLFLPAEIIQSIAALSNVNRDSRTIPIGEAVYDTGKEQNESGPFTKASNTAGIAGNGETKTTDVST
jgi:Family of unknown function (DUF6338)